MIPGGVMVIIGTVYAQGLVDGLHKGRGHSRAAVIECQTCLLVTLDCHMSHQSTRQRLIIYVWEGRPRT